MDSTLTASSSTAAYAAASLVLGVASVAGYHFYSNRYVQVLFVLVLRMYRLFLFIPYRRRLPDYPKLTGVPNPQPLPDFDITTAKPRPYRPFRWDYHQTMCASRLLPSLPFALTDIHLPLWLILDPSYQH